MTDVATVKDISVNVKKTYRLDTDYAYAHLELRHKNNLILDNIEIKTYPTTAYVEYNKPYTEKYLCLVVEWIVNNHNANSIKFYRKKR